MNDEIIKDVTNVAGEAVEAAKDVAQAVTPQAKGSNPWVLVGAFVGGVVVTIAGSKAIKGIKGLADKKKSEKDDKAKNEEPDEQDDTEDKKDKNKK